MQSRLLLFLVQSRGWPWITAGLSWVTKAQPFKFVLEDTRFLRISETPEIFIRNCINNCRILKHLKLFPSFRFSNQIISVSLPPFISMAPFFPLSLSFPLPSSSSSSTRDGIQGLDLLCRFSALSSQHWPPVILMLSCQGVQATLEFVFLTLHTTSPGAGTAG